MEVNYMTCFLWGITWWHSKGPVLDDPSSPWQFTEKKEKKKQTRFWHKLKANSIAKEKVRGISREPTQNPRTQGTMSIWGLTFQVTDKLLRVTIRPFTHHTSCLQWSSRVGVWIYGHARKKVHATFFLEFGTRFYYNFFLFVFCFFVVWNDYKYKLSLYSSLQYTKPTTNLQQANWLTFTYPCSSLRDVSTHP